jgi:hypothetical protein
MLRSKLNLTDADRTTNRRSEARTSRESYVKRVFVTLPLFVGEQTAEMGEAEADCLIRTQGLCIVYELLA